MHAGFTLIELMISIGVMGVISTVVVTLLSPKTLLTKVQDAKRLSAVSSLERGFTQYQIDKSSLPGNGQIPEHVQNAKKICREGITTDPACINVDSILPYLPTIPVDPAEPCANYTGYVVYTETSRVHAVSQYMGESGAPSTTCGPVVVPVLSSLASSNLTGTAATITWVTDVAANSTVEYGLTTSYGSASATDPSFVTNHSVRLTGMTTATLYHYRAKSNAGGSDGLSSDGTFTTSTVSYPVISSVASSGITSTTATITWTTNQQADSQVQYGLTISYTDLTNVDPAWVTSHSVTLTGLTPSTTYHYRARSANSSSLLTNGSDMTFTTSAGPDVTPPVLSSITSSGITDTDATITWTTDELADTQVDYGTSIFYGSTTTLADTSPMVTSHSQGLSGLTASTTYHYRVKSKDAAGNLTTSGDNTFTTGAGGPPDTTAPVLSNVRVSATGATTMTVDWDTDEGSDTQIEYGPTVSYGSTTTLADTSPMVTTHTQDITGLSSLTTYHYRVKSKDAAANLATSGDFILTSAGSYLALDSTGSVGTYSSIAIGSDGFPVISYYDATGTNLKFIKCGNADCSSGNITRQLDTPIGGIGSYTSIIVPADGLPFIAYYASSGGDLKTIKCGDASCSTTTITLADNGGTNNVGQYTSVALANDGYPMIAYYDVTALDLKYLKCGNAACNSGNTIVSLDSANSVGSYASIAKGADGFPVISYSDSVNADLKVIKCGDVLCSTGNAITAVDTVNSVGYYLSIVVPADGLPFIVEYTSSGGDTKVVKCGNAACSSGNTLTVVDSVGTTGSFASVALAADGLPMLSYYDTTNTNLKYLKCGNAACTSGNTTKTLDVKDITGQYTAIARGADGFPVITYYDATAADLNFLKCTDAVCTQP